ncbi:MAG: hypothetical protein H6727_17125 [Myxococcales bacterium]|nr:hypothetical protein [Myxococcales bacterium]
MFRESTKEQAWYDFLMQQGVLGFFAEPVTLRSGRVSHWYVNWRSVAEDAWALEQCVGFLLDFVKGLPVVPETIFGVAEGASKLALLAQFQMARQADTYGPGSHVLAMGRGKAKTHGAIKDRYFLGVPRGKTLLIEDVTTTGDSLLGALASLKEAQVEVVGALSLTDRCEPRADGRHLSEVLGEEGIPFWSMSHVDVLLPKIWGLTPPAAAMREAVREEARQLFGDKISAVLV